VQQGDPFGPLLFNISLAQVLNSFYNSEFVGGYLDDVERSPCQNLPVGEGLQRRSRSN